jgi:shikimate 5-dehydrogenase
MIVNCTTIGMRYSPEEGQSPLAVDAIVKDVLVYDLVYNPPETPLLKNCKKRRFLYNNSSVGSAIK